MKRLIALAGAVVILLAIGAAVFFIRPDNAETAEKPESSSAAPYIPAARPLTDEDRAFLKDYVFVGDSITTGYYYYDYLPLEQVVAKKNVAVRTIFSYRFMVGGKELNAVDALAALGAENVVFSLGINDINVSTEEEFCENYADLLRKAHEAVPQAKLYAASITPVTARTHYCKNEKIDRYNEALRTYLAENLPECGWVDIASVLKDDENCLRKDFSGEDGVHLLPPAYELMLSSLCDQLNR